MLNKICWQFIYHILHTILYQYCIIYTIYPYTSVTTMVSFIAHYTTLDYVYNLFPIYCPQVPVKQPVAVPVVHTIKVPVKVPVPVYPSKKGT